MDEGWTRLVLERFGFPYETFHNADIMAGDLIERIDVLLSRRSAPGRSATATGPTRPSRPTSAAWRARGSRRSAASSRTAGRSSAWRTPAASSSRRPGAARQGRAGRTCRRTASTAPARSSPSATTTRTAGTSIRRLPDRRDAGRGLGLLRRLARPSTTESGEGGRVLARYADAGLLESGWLLGAEHLDGKAAVVEAGRRRRPGRPLRLPAPAPRASRTGRSRLLFNALLGPGEAEDGGD